MTMVDKYRQVETEIEDFLEDCQMNTYDAILILHWTLDSFLLDLQNSKDFSLKMSPLFFKWKLIGSKPVKPIVDQILLNIMETYNFCNLSSIYHCAYSLTNETNFQVVLIKIQEL